MTKNLTDFWATDFWVIMQKRNDKTLSGLHKTTGEIFLTEEAAIRAQKINQLLLTNFQVVHLVAIGTYQFNEWMRLLEKEEKMVEEKMVEENDSNR